MVCCMWPGCGKPPFTLPSSYPLSTPIFPSGCNPNRKEEPPLARNSIIEADRKERVGWKKEEQCWCEVEDSKTKPAKRRKEGAEKLTEATACHAKARRQAKMEEEDIDKTKLRLKPERNSKRNPKGLKLRGGWDARSLFGGCKRWWSKIRLPDIKWQAVSVGGQRLDFLISFV